MAWQVSTSDKCLSDVPVVRTRRYGGHKHLTVGKDCEAFVGLSIFILICPINFRRCPEMWLMFLAVLTVTYCAKYCVIMR